MGTAGPRPLDVVVARLIDRLGPDLVEAWEERASIREFLGGLPRIEAERAALLDIFVQSLPLAWAPVHLLRAKMQGVNFWLVAVDVQRARQQLELLGASDVVEVEFVQALIQRFGGMAALAVLPGDGEASM